jgi:hypothetical protein
VLRRTPVDVLERLFHDFRKNLTHAFPRPPDSLKNRHKRQNLDEIPFRHNFKNASLLRTNPHPRLPQRIPVKFATLVDSGFSEFANSSRSSAIRVRKQDSASNL